ncbi:uncharacterized protein TNCV_1228501 [Trichonephila clavipes]|nr:uncharacterized protein TNCV_1228501 [Trichonephila clavipes]
MRVWKQWIDEQPNNLKNWHRKTEGSLSRQTIDGCVCNGLMSPEPGKLIGTKLSFQINHASICGTMMAKFLLDSMPLNAAFQSAAVHPEASLELSFSRITHAHMLQRMFEASVLYETSSLVCLFTGYVNYCARVGFGWSVSRSCSVPCSFKRRTFAALYKLGQRKQVCLQWIPPHVGVAGNETADELVGKFWDLPDHSSSVLSHSEIHSLHRVKMNLT